MALVERNESKSIRVNSANEHGNEVLSCNATYSNRNIMLVVEMLDADYCSQNTEDVQNAITAFISRLNGELTESNLPIIQSQ